jgi:predicted glutamine amidotransferase
VFSFTGLALRGGQTGPHADGWGLSLYERRFARTFLEHHPAFSSPLARFLRENPTLTQLAVAHIRKMTRGIASIENTHPFARVWHGRHLVFAHNGTLPRVKERALRGDSTLGDTDSEHAFCVILEVLREAYPTAYPDDPLRLGATLFEISNELARDGMLNFLLADGDHLFARCGDHLYWTLRNSTQEHATLVDAELKVRVGDILGPSDDAHMAVVATAPLTRDETWHKAAPGTLWVFSRGSLVHTFDPPPGYEAGSSVAPPWEPV